MSSPRKNVAAALHACKQVIAFKVQQNRHRKLALAVVAIVSSDMQKRPYTRKRFWVNKIFELRHENGFYHNTFQVMYTQEEDFHNLFRMSISQYNELLELVRPKLEKIKLCREPISPGERLAVTLRFVIFVLLVYLRFSFSNLNVSRIKSCNI